jgi:hypothetical protein
LYSAIKPGLFSFPSPLIPFCLFPQFPLFSPVSLFPLFSLFSIFSLVLCFYPSVGKRVHVNLIKVEKIERNVKLRLATAQSSRRTYKLAEKGLSLSDLEIYVRSSLTFSNLFPLSLL